MRVTLTVLFCSFFLIAGICSPVLAHVPILATGHENLADAYKVENPEKSWVIYDQITHQGEVKYYRFEMPEGSRLYTGLIVPDRSEFIPVLFIMGPDIKTTRQIPSDITIPAGYGVDVVEGEYPDLPEYEPFTPSALYSIAEYSHTITSNATYFVAIFEPNHTGNYGLVVGFNEEFGLLEWLIIPFSTIAVHLWEGQSLPVIILPLILVILAGILLILKFNKPVLVPLFGPGWIGSISGLLYIGSGCIVLSQMAVALMKTGPDSAAIVTLVLAVVPIILGFVLIQSTIRFQKKRKRFAGVMMLIAGGLGLLFWAGLIAGPLLAGTAGLIALFGGET